jgi:hypothetical protein
MSAATTDPKDCKAIATAGLLDTVEGGDVAVAISDSQQPRTLSAQSGSEGPDAATLLNELSGKMAQCENFKVSVLGQSYEVASKELQAETDGEKTFATISTRGGNESDMLMQISAAQGRLLVVATKGGANLGDADQKELEDVVNQVLGEADAGSPGTVPSAPGTSSTSGTPTSGTSTSGMPKTGPTQTSTQTSTETSTATVTGTPSP